MADNNTVIQLMSNVKIITSGNAPTVANLLPGQAAFGKINTDGKYHFFGNTGEGGGEGKVVDIVLDTLASYMPDVTLEDVLTKGNTATLDIQFVDSEGNLKAKVGPTGMFGTAFTIQENDGNAFLDHNKPVLSAYAGLTLTADDAAQMRNVLSVYSKDEIDAKLGSVLHMKGSVESFTDLPTDAEVGDVYNIKTSGGTDVHGVSIKAGDNVVWIAAQGETPAGWDVLSGVVDLTNYYTKEEIDQIKTSLDTSIAEAKQAADNAQTAADSAQTTADDAKTAVEELSEKIVTNGDGTKVLTDNGTYENLELSVIAI